MESHKSTPITDAMEDAVEGVRRVTALTPKTKTVGVIGSAAVTALGLAATGPGLFIGGVVGLGYVLTRRTRKKEEKVP